MKCILAIVMMVSTIHSTNITATRITAMLQLNVKVGHYCDNDTVDLCIGELCSLKILIVEYFEFYHRLK